MIEYIKKFIKVLMLPLIFGLSQILIILIFTLIFNGKIYNNIKIENSNLQVEEIDNMYKTYYQSKDYINELTTFVNDNTIWIILISALIFLPIFIIKYKKFNIKSNYKMNTNIIYIIISGLSIAIFLNTLFIIFNDILNINTSLTQYKYLFTLILSTGIIGPILEELLFRGIIYNKLKEFNKENIAFILTTLIFAFFHDSITQIIYAFIIGFISIKIYQKTNNLISSIIFHMISNIVVVILINSLANLNIVLKVFEIIISLLIFIFSYKMMNKTLKMS